MVKIKPISASQIAEVVGGTILSGSLAGVEVSTIGEPLELEGSGVAFIISESFVRDVPQTKALVLVVNASLAEKVVPLLPASVKACIGCNDAYLGLSLLSKVIADHDEYQDWRLSDRELANVHYSAKIDSTAKVGVGAVIGQGAVIGARTTILPNAVIGPMAAIGEDCTIFPGVVIYPKTQIGHRVRVHANVVLGSDGFGYARGPQGSVKIWHLGRVIIGDDVEIGAGTMIDRGTLKDTVIERGAKIDNLVQIGHNGWVKSHAILCAQVGMAGNATVGVGAILAGKVGVADKVEIGDGAIVGPMSGLSKDVKRGEVVMGQQPAKPRREWWKLIVLFERLPELYDRVKKLEQKQ